jgi:hypothetical protein
LPLPADDRASQPPGGNLPPAPDAARGPAPADAAAKPQDALGSGVRLPQMGAQEGSGFRLRLAPIRWSGNLGDSVSWSTGADQPRRFQHVLSGNLRGSTYLWQPWFAQISANLGFVSGSERTGSGTRSELAVDNRNANLVGGMALSLFPASRFPFNASVDVDDSRTSGILTDEDFQRTRLSLRQDYTPQGGRTQYSLGIDRSIVDSVRSGRDTVDVLRAAVSHTLDQHNFQFAADHTANTVEGIGTGFSFDSVNLRHSWHPRQNLSVENFAFASRTETSVFSDALTVENKSGFYELSSFTNWQPDTERPLLVVGSVRLFGLSNESGGTTSDSGSLTGGLSANYSYSQNVSLFGSTQVSRVQSDSDTRLLTVSSAGATYTSDVVNLGQFAYTWNSNTTGTLQTGSAEGNLHVLTAGVGHNFFRSLWADERSSFAVNLGQSFGGSEASGTGTQGRLGNSANATWVIRQSESFITTLSANISDERGFGDSATSFTLVGLQANGNIQFSRYSTGSANFSLTGTRQDNPDGVGSTTNWVAYGTLGYQHARVFNVPALRYTALYTANTQRLNSRGQGDLNATPELPTQMLEQRLDYRIGKLDLQALLRIGEIDGKKNALIGFRVNRAFGDF